MRRVWRRIEKNVGAAVFIYPPQADLVQPAHAPDGVWQVVNAAAEAEALGHWDTSMNVECLHGTICSRVFEHYPGNSTFECGPASLAVDCLWRIVVNGKVALTSRDHGQQFGRPAPIDAHVGALALLSTGPVVAVSLAEHSADLYLEFEGGHRLEVIADSSHYEPWNLRAPGVHFVVLGGGQIADFSSNA